MKIYKFGGASISGLERIKSTANIIQGAAQEKLIIVISAMGKTTNALEKVAEAFFQGKKTEALDLFNQIKDNHLTLLKYLTVTQWLPAEMQLKQFFTEVEWMIHDKPVRNYDYYYDQIVCCGELLSSTLVTYYLKEQQCKATWLDARDLLRTDDTFRNANVDWTRSEQMIQQTVGPLFEEYDIVITQGFIGSTDENESTTLGREGSDYTAAIFANILQGESVTIWKDVDAVMSADPKKYPDASILSSLSFTEVIEMAYYGAQVIHPKTIKPLQNKNIPLQVKSFLDPSLPGTLISQHASKQLPPIIVHKENQVLIQFKTKDFSFMEGEPIQHLHGLFTAHRISPNCTQNTAISLWCSFDHHAERIEALAADAAQFFDVEMEKNLSLLTIRHYKEESIESLTKGKTILLEQKTQQTIQLLMR